MTDEPMRHVKIIYHLEAPRGDAPLEDQIHWAISEAEPQSQKLLNSMREGAVTAVEVNLIDTYVTVETELMGFGPRARLAVVMEWTEVLSEEDS